MMKKIETYACSSINTYSKCASWENILACGMFRSIVLIEQNCVTSKIFKQFTVHEGIVTCIYWISDYILISGDSIGGIVLWIFTDNYDIQKTYKHKIDDVSVNDLCCQKINESYLISCVAESNFKLIEFTNESFNEIKSISHGRNFNLCTNICIYNEKFAFISCGMDSGKVLCYIFNLITSTILQGVPLVGHEDWVVSLHSTRLNDGLFIVSSSQDNYIRVWKVCIKENNEEKLKNALDVEKYELDDLNMYIYLEGILIGHENWVTSVRILKYKDSLRIFSFSMDKSIIIWEKQNSDYSEWIEITRLGQIGGNGLGFIGGCVKKDGNFLLGFSYQGDPVSYGVTETEEWNNIRCWGGHFDVVEDLSWDVDGNYLITVSKDQTCRIHGNCLLNNRGWTEIGRPQIHGFDLKCVTSISSTQFVSGADEKIARIYQMNQQFANKLEHELQINLPQSLLSKDVVSNDALGLSNRFLSTNNDGDGITENLLSSDEMGDNTLWPESLKLYGHGFELFRICSNGKLVLTSCKATKAENAEIFVWRCSDWKLIQKLKFHKSTVVSTKFNHKGNILVSVSKDRHWALWKWDEKESQFQLVHSSANGKPAHSKIIWDVDWSNNDELFVTASRDSKIIAWNSDTGEKCGDAFSLGDSVNAIACFPPITDRDLFAVGLETGQLLVVEFDKSIRSWSVICDFGIIHDAWISRLQFCPKVLSSSEILLASCGLDNFVKIQKIQI